MSTNVPTNIWRRTSGNGELSVTEANLITDDGKQFITLNGVELIVLSGSYSPIPDSEWEVDEIVPTSVWRKTSGLDESVLDGQNSVIDPQGNFLVDTTGNQVVDTGIDMNVTPDSIWTEDDAI